MNSIRPEDFYTEKNIIEDQFYQVPKHIIKNIYYKKLSLGAKLLYSILRDRQTVSIKNKWKDENGQVYFYYDCVQLSEVLNISTSTLNRHKKELEKFYLLIQKRQGQGKPNRLYLLKAKSIEDTGDILNSQIDNSRIVDLTILELSKSLTSKNEYNKNELSKNETNTHIICNGVDSQGFYNRKEELLENLMQFTDNNNYLILLVIFYESFRKQKHIKHGILFDSSIRTIFDEIEDSYISEYITEEDQQETVNRYIDMYFAEKREYYSMQEFFKSYNFKIWHDRIK